MRKLIIGIAVAGMLAAPSAAFAASGGNPDKGFNENGYNYGARIFNGPADGVDKVLDGKVWGDPTYAKDHLVMKWNALWDYGNENDWSGDPAQYLGAWTSNEWNGQVPGGSGWSEHYKIVFIGPGGENSPYWTPGGYLVWGQFEVVMDQGTFDGDHEWYAHATIGYGALK